MTIQQFKEEHKDFFDLLLSDTWLCQEPIPVEETEACWKWALGIDVETIPIENFEETFKISFKEITDWWNRDILQVC